MLESIVTLGPAKASMFQVSSPLFTAVIAWLFLREKLGSVEIVAMAMAIAGLLLVSPASLSSLGRPRGSPMAASAAAFAAPAHARERLRSLLRSGMVLGFSSSAAYAAGNVLRGAGIRRWDEPILGALLGAVAGIALHVLLSAGTRDVIRKVRTSDRRGVLMFAISGMLTISAQMCVIAAMRYAPVAVVALITLCTPLIVFPLSYFLLKNQERIGAITLAGGALALAGIAVLILQ
jgi:drug/metabolite transporter (DMT)-like permease